MGERRGVTEAMAAQPPQVVTADRQQIELRPFDLESLLPPEHRARAIWAMVEWLELTKFHETLVALWLYATSEGVGSAHELARLCEAHDAYGWLCGGMGVTYHTLSDHFRVSHEAALDALLTQVLAAMLHRGLVTLEQVAHDGMRVRASAGAASFRREPSPRACLAAAEAAGIASARGWARTRRRRSTRNGRPRRRRRTPTAGRTARVGPLQCPRADEGLVCRLVDGGDLQRLALDRGRRGDMSPDGDAASTRSAATTGAARLAGTGVPASSAAAVAPPRRLMTASTATPVGWPGTGAATGFLHRL